MMLPSHLLKCSLMYLPAIGRYNHVNKSFNRYNITNRYFPFNQYYHTNGFQESNNTLKLKQSFNSKLPSKPIESMIPHQFDFEEACRRFVHNDKDGFFSRGSTSYFPFPTISALPDNKKKLILTNKEPLKMVYLPIFTFGVTVSNISYSGQYGIDHEQVRYDNKNKAYIHYYYTDDR